MFVNKLPFLVTISWNIQFGTAELLLNCQEATVDKSIQSVMQLYSSCGFLVQMAHADSEFEPLWGSLAQAGSSLNVCSNDEHVPKVEHFIWTIKEHMQCMYHLVSFTHFPTVMLKEMIMVSVFWLNMFPPHDVVSKMLSPCALMTGFNLDYNKHCCLQSGAYVQTHET